MGRLFKIGLGLLLIGVGVVAIFSILSENNVFASVNEQDFVYTELTYDATDFDSFDFSFVNRDMIVRTSDDDQIRITYYVTEKDIVTVDESTSMLTLKNEVKWYDQLFTGFNWMVDDDFYDVYLYLPSSVVYSMNISTSNGTMDMQNVNEVNVLKFHTSNGRINIDNTDASSMDLSTSNGGIQVTDVIATGDLDMQTSNGRLTLENITADTIYGKSSNGRINASNLVSDSISLDTSNGDIILDVTGDKADFEVNINTSNGHMEFDGIRVIQEHFNLGAANEINLDTSNGDIVVTFNTN